MLRFCPRESWNYAESTAVHLTPKEIFDVAQGRRAGDQIAASAAFEELGEIAGDALADAVTLVDGLVVLGGGLTGAASFFLPHLVGQMNTTLQRRGGSSVPRLEMRVYNLEEAEDLNHFLMCSTTQVYVPGTSRTVDYDSTLRVGVGLSRLGTSRAIAVGAYAFALNVLSG